MAIYASAKRNVGPIDRYFKISERKSTYLREVLGGLTTFLVAAYIIVVNPAILSFAGVEGLEGMGPPFAPTLAMTCLTAGIMSLLMGLYARYPIMMAPGMGLNAVVAFGLVAGAGLTWQEAMGVILMEGILILALVLTGLRESVMNAIPHRLKSAIAVGIGLFILLIGLVNGGVVVMGVPGAPLALGSFTSPTFLILVVGLLLITLFEMWRIPGGILLGILVTTVLAIVVNAMTGGAAYANLPGVAVLPSAVFALPDFSTIGAGINFGSFFKIGVVGTVVAVFSIAMADFFDSIGTFVGVGRQGGFLNEKGEFPPDDLRRLLIVDSIGPIVGGAASASSNTSFIESGAGVAEGARTGLASVVTGVLFLACMFLSPLASVIPAQATAPALIIVGFLMFAGNIQDIVKGFDEMSYSDRLAEGFPVLLTMLLMPFAYSITAGIGAGFIAYTVLQLARGRMPHWLMTLSSVAFIAYFLFRI